MSCRRMFVEQVKVQVIYGLKTRKELTFAICGIESNAYTAEKQQNKGLKTIITSSTLLKEFSIYISKVLTCNHTHTVLRDVYIHKGIYNIYITKHSKNKDHT